MAGEVEVTGNNYFYNRLYSICISGCYVRDLHWQESHVATVTFEIAHWTEYSLQIVTDSLQLNVDECKYQ
jgi:hypothetical protein